MAKVNPRILVIEDNPVDIAKLAMKLQKMSSDITYTTSAESGLAIFKGALRQNAPYDILITDIVLPGMDGKSFISEVRALEDEELSSFVKIIAMSAEPPKAHVLEACRVGAGCYLEKPISEETLSRALINTGLF